MGVVAKGKSCRNRGKGTIWGQRGLHGLFSSVEKEQRGWTPQAQGNGGKCWGCRVKRHGKTNYQNGGWGVFPTIERSPRMPPFHVDQKEKEEGGRDFEGLSWCVRGSTIFHLYTGLLKNQEATSISGEKERGRGTRKGIHADSRAVDRTNGLGQGLDISGGELMPYHLCLGNTPSLAEDRKK